MNADNPKAFPQHGWSSDPETVARMQHQGGMTLRDYFAAQAVGPLMASDGFEIIALKGGIKLEDLTRFAAEQAYEIADAMLQMRAEQPTAPPCEECARRREEEAQARDGMQNAVEIARLQ